MARNEERKKKDLKECKVIKTNDSKRHLKKKGFEANQVFQLRTLHKRIVSKCKMNEGQCLEGQYASHTCQKTRIDEIRRGETSYVSEAIYASGTDFFRWKRLRVRDLLRGFLSLLTVRPRERPPRRSSSGMYLSL